MDASILAFIRRHRDIANEIWGVGAKKNNSLKQFWSL
jgi:hypothetical protein